MKIVHVLPFFLPDTVAGTEVYCWSLCKHLQSRGITCEVVIPNYGKDQTETYVYDNIKVIKYAEPTQATRAHQMGLALPGGIAAFKAYLQEARPDCVHFHAIYGSIGITVQHIIEAKNLGFHTVYTMHIAGHVCRNQTLVYKQKEICDGVIRPRRCAACMLVYNQKPEWMADLISGMSAGLQKMNIDLASWNNPLGTGLSLVNRIVDLKNDLQRIAGSCDKVVLYAKWFRSILIANGFPEEKLEYIAPALPATGNAHELPSSLTFNSSHSIKLVFAGRISMYKGLDILLKALQPIDETKLELSIYGKHENDDYYHLCRKLSEGKANIHWRGLLSRENIIPAFSKHDALCLPSTFSEMSPLVIQEAFAAGIPVIAGDVYGNREQVIHSVNGLLFAFKSEADLNKQLQQIVDDPSLIGKMKSQVSMPAGFEQAGMKYEELYESL